MTDEQFQDYLHKMSHQKVIADTKWGFYEITEERITWLLETLNNEKVKSELKYPETYHSILTRWDGANFTQIDKEHNAIWRLQGGTIGIATGILSKEAEAAYIKNTVEHTR